MGKAKSLNGSVSNPNGLAMRVATAVAVREGVGDVIATVGVAVSVGLGDGVQVAIRVRVP